MSDSPLVTDEATVEKAAEALYNSQLGNRIFDPNYADLSDDHKQWCRDRIIDVWPAIAAAAVAEERARIVEQYRVREFDLSEMAECDSEFETALMFGRLADELESVDTHKEGQ